MDTEFTDIVMEGDNSVVTKAILSSRTEFSWLGHLYEDVKCMAAGITTLSRILLLGLQKILMMKLYMDGGLPSGCFGSFVF